MVVEVVSALIYGSDNVVAKKLGDLLVSRGINVFWDDDSVGKPLYFFDFGDGDERYQEMTEKKVKICKIITNYELRITNIELDKNLDIRQVNLHDVYGVNSNGEWWFDKTVNLAARNQNLVLPPYGEKFRLLAIDDATEAIMRAVIISGTSGKVFDIAGNEIDSKSVAEALIDLAKMTKTQIVEQTPSPTLSLDRAREQEANFVLSSKALRWKPVVEFREGIKEVIAEAVAKVDEEARNKNYKLKNTNYELQIEDGIDEEKRYMIKAEIEEEEEKTQTSNIKHQNLNVKIEEEKEIKIKEREIVVEEDEVEEDVEEEVVGKKIDWKKVEPIKNNYELKITNYELKEEPKVKKITEIIKKKTRLPWGKVGLGLGGIMVFVGLVYGWFLWGVVDMAMNLQKPIKLLEEKKNDQATKLINSYKNRNKNLSWFWENSKLIEVCKISQEVLDIESNLVILADSMNKINGAVFEEKVIDFKLELTKVSKNLLEVETKVGIVEARLEGIRKWVPGRWRPEVDKASDLIFKNIDLISKMRQLTEVLPEILGLDGKRRDYIVLLQNEMELRATGGFIGSYGILSFQEGRLVSFDIKDVYEADGQLKGHVEPPEEIKRYLGEAGWFMRDANWKASFPDSAKDILWFFEKEMGRKVDGVIGVNLAVVKAMLNATGPIFVPDFKTNIDKDNLYEQAEFYSESKFFPGSVQKASFLGGIGKQLFSEISSLNTNKRWNLMMGLTESLEKNDLQIAMNETITNGVMADLGWNGEIFTGKCGDKNCYGDYLYVVESNLGVNKANYFLYRGMEQKIDIKENSVDRVLRINYENMAKTTSWPGGDYKNYLRIYVPIDVQVSEVSVNTGGQKQNIALNEVKMVNMYNKRELGFLVMVPILKKVAVEVRYSSKFEQMGDKFSYLLYVQRQPGFGDTGMVNLVSIPSNYQPMQVMPVASVVSGKLLFNQKLDKDIRLGVEISK